jgi:hypothetical protein
MRLGKQRHIPNYFGLFLFWPSRLDFIGIIIVAQTNTQNIPPQQMPLRIVSAAVRSFSRPCDARDKNPKATMGNAHSN